MKWVNGGTKYKTIHERHERHERHAWHAWLFSEAANKVHRAEPTLATY
jgi:hypothetical protein